MSQDYISLLGAVRAWDPLHAWICLVVAVCVGEDFQGLGWGMILGALRKRRDS